MAKITPEYLRRKYGGEFGRLVRWREVKAEMEDTGQLVPKDIQMAALEEVATAPMMPEISRESLMQVLRMQGLRIQRVQDILRGMTKEGGEK